MTLDDLLDIAGDWLTESGMRLIVDDSNSHVYQVWDAAEAEFGQNIALIHAPADEGPLGGTVKVHWHYSNTRYAEAIVEAFAKAGCDTAWGGSPSDAVHVNLGYHR